MNIENLKTKSEEDLLEIKGIGGKVANSVNKFLENENMK